MKITIAHAVEGIQRKTFVITAQTVVQKWMEVRRNEIDRNSRHSDVKGRKAIHFSIFNIFLLYYSSDLYVFGYVLMKGVIHNG